MTLNKQIPVEYQYFAEESLDANGNKCTSWAFLTRHFIFLFPDLGGSIIYGKGKPFGACVTPYGSGYWWGCTHTNDRIYAPTIDRTIINYGKIDCKREQLSILHRNI